AEICRDRNGNPEPDPELRDTESVPLKESIDAYVRREVLPHVPDAWVDETKTKVGYEIPLNRHFYVYEPPRPLEEIERDIKALEAAYSRSTIRAGDLVISIGPSFGKLMVVSPELTGANLTQGTARIRLKSSCNPRFVFWALRSSFCQQQWESQVSGATFRAL